MKQYSNFNEMFANNNTNKNLSVFNDYRSLDQFEDDIDGYLYGAFKEWYDNLTTKQKQNFARFGYRWFNETEQDDVVRETTYYKRMCSDIQNGGVDNLFVCMQDSNQITATILDNFGVDITDEQELRQQYGENYKLATVDCLIWCLENYWDKFEFWAKDSMKEARKEYFEQFDFDKDYDGDEE